MAKGQKRGNGEGTAPTKRKDGRWWCRYTVHTLSGSRRKAVYGKTRQEAAKKLAKALAERDGGLAFNPESITLAAFLERWLNLSIKQNVAKSTYTRYERSVRLKLSHLGPVQVNKLTVGHVEGLRNTLLQRGDAPASVAFDLTVLSIAMNTAIRWGLAQLNPTRGVTRPKDREQKMHALSESEAASLIEVVRETRYEALYIMALKLGPRVGELCGLRWADIDLEARRMRIESSVETWGDYTRSTPKGGSGRAIKLPLSVASTLKAHHKLQLEERIATKEWEDPSLVFSNQRGAIYRHASLTRTFHRHLAKAGLPKIHFHDLRHTAATLMVRGGTPIRVVADILGHADPAMTLRRYSHVLSDMQDSAADKMDLYSF